MTGAVRSYDEPMKINERLEDSTPAETCPEANLPLPPALYAGCAVAGRFDVLPAGENRRLVWETGPFPKARMRLPPESQPGNFASRNRVGNGQPVYKSWRGFPTGSAET